MVREKRGSRQNNSNAIPPPRTPWRKVSPPLLHPLLSFFSLFSLLPVLLRSRGRMIMIIIEISTRYYMLLSLTQTTTLTALSWLALFSISLPLPLSSCYSLYFLTIFRTQFLLLLSFLIEIEMLTSSNMTSGRLCWRALPCRSRSQSSHSSVACSSRYGVPLTPSHSPLSPHSSLPSLPSLPSLHSLPSLPSPPLLSLFSFLLLLSSLIFSLFDFQLRRWNFHFSYRSTRPLSS